jgi:hypothetical protein
VDEGMATLGIQVAARPDADAEEVAEQRRLAEEWLARHASR